MDLVFILAVFTLNVLSLLKEVEANNGRQKPPEMSFVQLLIGIIIIAFVVLIFRIIAVLISSTRLAREYLNSKKGTKDHEEMEIVQMAAKLELYELGMIDQEVDWKLMKDLAFYRWLVFRLSSHFTLYFSNEMPIEPGTEVFMDEKMRNQISNLDYKIYNAIIFLVTVDDTFRHRGIKYTKEGCKHGGKVMCAHTFKEDGNRFQILSLDRDVQEEPTNEKIIIEEDMVGEERQTVIGGVMKTFTSMISPLENKSPQIMEERVMRIAGKESSGNNVVRKPRSIGSTNNVIKHRKYQERSLVGVKQGNAIVGKVNHAHDDMEETKQAGSTMESTKNPKQPKEVTSVFIKNKPKLPTIHKNDNKGNLTRTKTWMKRNAALSNKPTASTVKKSVLNRTNTDMADKAYLARKKLVEERTEDYVTLARIKAEEANARDQKTTKHHFMKMKLEQFCLSRYSRG